MQSLLALILIYLASWCYVIASYYHLNLHEWTFLKAFLIAIPFVVVEYMLSLNGNKLASHSLSPVQIVLVTICFYMINICILNVFVMKAPINVVRDGLAFLFILGALVLSTNVHL